MSQEAFIRDVLKTWEMTNCRARRTYYGRVTGRTRIRPRRYTSSAENGRIIDLAKYENETGHYLCTVEDFVDDDKGTKESINGRSASIKVFKWY